MPDIAPLSPLMQPVQYEGQTYYTSQYFHQQYLANSQQKGKHRRYDSFMRLLRHIEAYALYVHHGDIVEVQWDRDKPHFCGYLKPLFQAAGYHPLTLLNATAQVEMAHHLDDTLSQQMAVASSTLVARHGNPLAALEQFPELKAIADMARSVLSLTASTAESRLIAETAKATAEQAKTEAAHATANAARALESQLFFTVAEYVCFEKLQRQVPETAYKPCSDHLRLYCMDNAIPFRKIPVWGKRWDDEYGFHISTYTDAFPGWLARRYAQADLHLVQKTGD